VLLFCLFRFIRIFVIARIKFTIQLYAFLESFLDDLWIRFSHSQSKSNAVRSRRSPSSLALESATLAPPLATIRLIEKCSNYTCEGLIITLGKAVVRREQRPWLFSHELAKPEEVVEEHHNKIRLDGDANHRGPMGSIPCRISKMNIQPYIRNSKQFSTIRGAEKMDYSTSVKRLPSNLVNSL